MKRMSDNQRFLRTRETRLWVTSIVVPAVSIAGTIIASNPKAQEAIANTAVKAKDAVVNGATKLKNRFKRKPKKGNVIELVWENGEYRGKKVN